MPDSPKKERTFMSVLKSTAFMVTLAAINALTGNALSNSLGCFVFLSYILIVVYHAFTTITPSMLTYTPRIEQKKKKDADEEVILKLKVGFSHISVITYTFSKERRTNIKDITFTKLEKCLLADVIHPEDIKVDLCAYILLFLIEVKVSFDDIGGLEDVKSALYESVILPTTVCFPSPFERAKKQLF